MAAVHYFSLKMKKKGNKFRIIFRFMDGAENPRGYVVRKAAQAGDIFTGPGRSVVPYIFLPTASSGMMAWVYL
jgi:hypothetical protein